MTNATDAMDAMAHSQAYAFLAEAFGDPDNAMLAWLNQILPVAEAAFAMIGGTNSRAALAALRSEIVHLDEAGLAHAHRSVFGHGVSGDCPPYEGEYGQPHIFQKTQSLADNVGFLQAFGLAPAPNHVDRLDHIGVELEFMHVLAAKEAYALIHGHGEDRLAIVREARRKYLKDHLGRWAPEFAARLETKAHDGPYAALARLLAAFVMEQACALDITLAPPDSANSEPEDGDDSAVCNSCVAAAVLDPALRGVS